MSCWFPGKLVGGIPVPDPNVVVEMIASSLDIAGNGSFHPFIISFQPLENLLTPFAPPHLKLTNPSPISPSTSQADLHSKTDDREYGHPSSLSNFSRAVNILP